MASAKGAYNDLSDKVDPRAALLISDSWGDGTFGALFSIAYSERNAIEEGTGTVRWDSGISSGNFNAGRPMRQRVSTRRSILGCLVTAR